MAGAGEGSPPSSYPRVLHVDTTLAPAENRANELWQDTLDYGVYGDTPAWQRRVETLLRLDVGLARRAMERAGDFDVLLCGSEKVAVPLALLGCRTPIVAVVHSLGLPLKRKLLRLLGVARRWAKVGVYTRADAELVTSDLGVPAGDVFSYASAPLGMEMGPPVREGIVVAAGVTRRDYATLIAALAGLPGCSAEIFAGSRYGDRDRSKRTPLPPWVRRMPQTEYATVVRTLRERARFVVVPLRDTHLHGAGITAILEAYALGKAVVATRTRGTADSVVDGVTGFLVAPGDVAGMRGAIVRLCADPDLAIEMGRAGRRFAEESYHPRTVTLRLRQVLVDAAARGQAPSSRTRSASQSTRSLPQ